MRRLRISLLIAVGAQACGVLRPTPVVVAPGWIQPAYERASIVCWVDSVVYHPPAAPTPERPTTRAEYSARVTHVWKGEVGRRIRLGVAMVRTQKYWAHSAGGRAHLALDQPTLIFAGRAQGGSLPKALEAAARDHALAMLYHLAREAPPPTILVAEVAPPPSVSIRSFARVIAANDSASGAATLTSLDVPDSCDVLVAALLRRVAEVSDWDERKIAAATLVRRAERGERIAKRAARSLFDAPSAEVRRAIVASCQYAKLFHREVKRARERDPSPDVRAEAERVVEWWSRPARRLPLRGATSGK